MQEYHNAWEPTHDLLRIKQRTIPCITIRLPGVPSRVWIARAAVIRAQFKLDWWWEFTRDPKTSIPRGWVSWWLSCLSRNKGWRTALINTHLRCATHPTSTRYRGGNVNEYLACTMSCGRQAMDKLVFSLFGFRRQGWYQLTNLIKTKRLWNLGQRRKPIALESRGALQPAPFPTTLRNAVSGKDKTHIHLPLSYINLIIYQDYWKVQYATSTLFYGINKSHILFFFELFFSSFPSFWSHLCCLFIVLLTVTPIISVFCYFSWVAFCLNCKPISCSFGKVHLT